ncbi:hypothetical protein I4U23_007352 [Adineta vaga]|nr:hypothetical protein I4U23_007352 [Adineta vaga]
MSQERISVGKHISDFLTKIFWHFNHTTPNFSYSNPNHSNSSIKNRGNQSFHVTSTCPNIPTRSHHPTRIRATTLSSIQEE